MVCVSGGSCGEREMGKGRSREEMQIGRGETEIKKQTMEQVKIERCQS
jgi:hypothetical protein